MTRIVGHGKAIFVVYALTRRCQPAHCCAALYHGTSRNRDSLASNNRAQQRVVDAVSSSLRYRGGSGTEEHAPSRQEADGEAEILRRSKPLPGTASNTSYAGNSLDGNERKGLRQRAKEMISQFLAGTKLLWREVVRARETSARKKAGESLSFQEYRLLRQVPRDLLKALPVLAVFAVPFAGNLAPVVGFLYPKALLPTQFWSSSQRHHYMLQDAVQQEISSFPKILRYLAMLPTPPRPNSTSEQLRAYGRWFEDEGSLKRLSRGHLKQLVMGCNTMPPAKKVAAKFFPKFALAAWLRKEAACISNDDLSLRKLMLPNNGQGGGVVVGDCGADGADDVDGAEDLGGELDLKLSPAEVAVLCWERGLLRSQHGEGGDMRWTMLGHEISEEEADAMLKSLYLWLSLYDEPSIAPASSATDAAGGASGAGATDRLSSSSEDGNTRRLPASMVLHASALLRSTFSARASSPVCHLRVHDTAR